MEKTQYEKNSNNNTIEYLNQKIHILRQKCEKYSNKVCNLMKKIIITIFIILSIIYIKLFTELFIKDIFSWNNLFAITFIYICSVIIVLVFSLLLLLFTCIPLFIMQIKLKRIIIKKCELILKL